MNWKLILQLSVFGLAMGIGTVFLIPSNIEPLCWLAIFIISAFLIAKDRREDHFLHGLFLGIANGIVSDQALQAGLSTLTSVIMGAIVTVAALVLAVNLLSSFTLKGEPA